MPTPIESWHFRDANFRFRRGRTDVLLDGTGTPPPPPPPGNGRDQLVYGEYLPDHDTAGIPAGTPLTAYNDPSVNSFSLATVGEPIVEKVIYGDMTPTFTSNSNQVFERCLFVGGTHTPGGASGVINCNSQRSGTGRIVLVDCDIFPRVPARNRDNIVGHRWEAYRCRMTQGVDGMGIFKNASNSNADVVAKGCFVYNLTYWYPDWRNGVSGDVWHSDGSHNDGAQLQGGKNVTLIGNRFHLTCSYGDGSQTHPTKSWLLSNSNLESRYAPGSNIIVQNNTGGGIDSTVVIQKNYHTHGGLSQLNVKTGITFNYTDNKHYRKTAVGPSWSGYWIRFDFGANSITGLNSGTTTTNTTNLWVDGPYAGNPLDDPRDLGVHYNPS